MLEECDEDEPVVDPEVGDEVVGEQGVEAAGGDPVGEGCLTFLEFLTCVYLVWSRVGSWGELFALAVVRQMMHPHS